MIIARASRFFKRGLLIIQALTIGVALWEAYKKSQSSPSTKFQEPDLDKKYTKDRDIIDETSWESFPASDPPASNKFT